MKLYIARHGETLWNTQKRMQGWGDSDLTPLGIKQARLLGKSLSSLEFNQVVSSPLGRTIETSKHVLAGRDIDLVINDDFKEMGFGSWEGQSPEILKKTYPDQYQNLWTDTSSYMPIDQGESFQQVYKRVIRGLDSLVKDNPHGNVLLITHGMIIQVLLVHIKGLTLSDLWKRPVVQPTSLSIVNIDKDNKMTIIKEDDTSHLE